MYMYHTGKQCQAEEIKSIPYCFCYIQFDANLAKQADLQKREDTRIRKKLNTNLHY